jgi:hypothetical protein
MHNGTTKDQDTLIGTVFTGLAAYTAIVAHSAAAKVIIASLETNTKSFKAKQDNISDPSKEVLNDNPLAVVVIAMSAVGIDTAANIRASISYFQDLAVAKAYGGIAPGTRHTDNAIHGESTARPSNVRTKNKMSRSGWIASNCRPTSRRCRSLRKRTEGKCHNAAVRCRAQRRHYVVVALPKAPTVLPRHSS